MNELTMLDAFQRAMDVLKELQRFDGLQKLELLERERSDQRLEELPKVNALQTSENCSNGLVMLSMV